MYKLLSSNNAKTVKGEKQGYKTFILYMAPHKQNNHNKNLCPFASKGCSKACLYRAGRGAMSRTQAARIRKADLFLSNKQYFLDHLFYEINYYKKKSEAVGMKICIRLNGTTDILWEKLKVPYTNLSLIESFPEVQFYDYTKDHTRFKKKPPKNYNLIFSRSENNEEKVISLLNKGVNVSVVFKDKLPKTYKVFKVINGDETDLRFLDPQGVVVGLKAKGKLAKQDTTGFVINSLT